MFKTLVSYKALGIIEVEIYRFDGKLLKIKRLTTLDQVKALQNQLNEVSLKKAV